MEALADEPGKSTAQVRKHCRATRAHRPAMAKRALPRAGALPGALRSSFVCVCAVGSVLAAASASIVTRALWSVSQVARCVLSCLSEVDAQIAAMEGGLNDADVDQSDDIPVEWTVESLIQRENEYGVTDPGPCSRCML